MTTKDKDDAKKLAKQDREFAQLIKKLKGLNDKAKDASLGADELESTQSEAKDTRRAAGKMLKQYQANQM